MRFHTFEWQLPFQRLEMRNIPRVWLPRGQELRSSQLMFPAEAEDSSQKWIYLLTHQRRAWHCAYCDFRQMCSLFSWNWPFMNYFRGQWHQAWPLIPNTQGVRCGFTGLGSQRTQGQRSQVEDSVWLSENSEVWLTTAPASFTLLCCKGETQALGLCRSPSQWWARESWVRGLWLVDVRFLDRCFP